MSDITFYTRETMENIPYRKYFEFFPCDTWSLQNYVLLVIEQYPNAEKKKAHHAFFNTLHSINNNICASKEVCSVAQKLLKNKKVSIGEI